MEFKDYYATLGVPKTATEKEFKQALPQTRPEAPSRRQSQLAQRKSRSGF